MLLWKKRDRKNRSFTQLDHKLFALIKINLILMIRWWFYEFNNVIFFPSLFFYTKHENRTCTFVAASAKVRAKQKVPFWHDTCVNNLFIKWQTRYTRNAIAKKHIWPVLVVSLFCINTHCVCTRSIRNQRFFFDQPKQNWSEECQQIFDAQSIINSWQPKTHHLEKTKTHSIQIVLYILMIANRFAYQNGQSILRNHVLWKWRERSAQIKN